MSCKIDGCSNSGKITQGMCRKHYMRWYRHGSPDAVFPPGIPGESRKHRLYSAWAGMVNRCHNPRNSSYHSYGALGVTVCDRWQFGDASARASGFECFLADMGERPEGKTLDRYPDNNGPYSPDNCRWATAKEQSANRTPEGVERNREAVRAAKLEYWRRKKAAPSHMQDAADVLDLDFEQVKAS